MDCFKWSRSLVQCNHIVTQLFVFTEKLYFNIKKFIYEYDICVISLVGSRYALHSVIASGKVYALLCYSRLRYKPDPIVLHPAGILSQPIPILILLIASSSYLPAAWVIPWVNT